MAAAASSSSPPSPSSSPPNEKSVRLPIANSTCARDFDAASRTRRNVAAVCSAQDIASFKLVTGIMVALPASFVSKAFFSKAFLLLFTAWSEGVGLVFLLFAPPPLRTIAFRFFFRLLGVPMSQCRESAAVIAVDDPGFTPPGFTPPGFTPPGFTSPGFTVPGTRTMDTMGRFLFMLLIFPTTEDDAVVPSLALLFVFFGLGFEGRAPVGVAVEALNPSRPVLYVTRMWTSTPLFLWNLRDMTDARCQMV